MVNEVKSAGTRIVRGRIELSETPANLGTICLEEECEIATLPYLYIFINV